MRDIKTKPVNKNIKALDKTSNLSHNTKNTYIRTREQAEHLAHNEDSNYVAEAEDKVENSTKASARKMVHTTEKVGTEALRRLREYSREKTRTSDFNPFRGNEEYYAGGQADHPALPSRQEELRLLPQGDPRATQTGRRIKQKQYQSKTKSVANKIHERKLYRTGRSGATYPKLKAGEPLADRKRLNGIPSASIIKADGKISQSGPRELARRRFIQKREKQLITRSSADIHQKSMPIEELLEMGKNLVPVEGIEKKLPTSKIKHGQAPSRTDRQLAQSGIALAKRAKAMHIQKPQAASLLQSVRRPLHPGICNTGTQIFSPSRYPVQAMNQSTKTTEKALKKSVKGNIKTAQKSVKTIKTAIKTGSKTSKVMVHNAAKAARAARNAAQATRMAARAAAFSAKVAVKALIATVKALIAAAKSLTALVAAGGWIALAVILVICLAAFFCNSAFGIFLSNENSNYTDIPMKVAVSRLNSEFSDRNRQIQTGNFYNTLQISGNTDISPNHWREMLAVYAVKTVSDPDQGMEVATLDDHKFENLRKVFWDMNNIQYWLETVTTTDEDGNESTETILHIDVSSKAYTDMIPKYGFNAGQVKMLNELMQDEYQELFMQLIGS